MVGFRDVSFEKTLADSSGVARHSSPVWSMQTKDGGKNTGVFFISGVPSRSGNRCELGVDRKSL